MSAAPRVLIAGESWVIYTTHVKGFDSMTTCSYGEGVGFLKTALEAGGIDVTHLPNHRAPTDFPTTLAALQRYDVVLLSDIGSNTLVLHPDTFERSVPTANRLDLLRDFVAAGGGLGMAGGYLSFQGIEGKARYAGTAVEEALPVTFIPYDDRVERPEGVVPSVIRSDHPVMAGLPATDWPMLLGYNRSTLKANATLLAQIGRDPLLAVHSFGRGRSFVFSSDCGPHWCPPSFLDWECYPRLWQQSIRWAAGRD